MKIYLASRYSRKEELRGYSTRIHVQLPDAQAPKGIGKRIEMHAKYAQPGYSIFPNNKL